MEGTKFTWFPKLTLTLERVPEGQRGALLWALALYGTYGTEPELDWPLDAIFESLREDIDNSKRAITSGGRGGRGNRKGSSDQNEAPFSNCETPLSECGNRPLEEAESRVCEMRDGGSEDAEPNPNHTNPNHTKTKKKGTRFAPPTVEQVRAYCVEKGYTFDPEAFVAFYESKGWMVGRNPMKSWPAACATWQKRQGKAEGGVRDEYSDL